MYAVIETGGKQYRVEVGTQLEVELIDANAGDTVTIDRVLLVADGDTTEIGRPTVAAASVSAEVLRQERGDKVISFKYRPKARRRVKKGHRQELHVLRIADIVLNGKSAADVVKKAATEAEHRAAASRGGRPTAGRRGCRARCQARRRQDGQGRGDRRREPDQGQGPRQEACREGRGRDRDRHQDPRQEAEDRQGGRSPGSRGRRG